MKMKVIEVKIEDGRIKISSEEVNAIGGSDYDLDKQRIESKEYTRKLLRVYKDILIGSLTRRMQACSHNLANHLKDIIYADEEGHIIYRREDNSLGNFNLPVFEAMRDCIILLDQALPIVLENPIMIDQMLKALLNDTEHNNEDRGTYKYSELISMLCKFHVTR